MVRTQIQLTEEQVNSLKRLANKLHVSLAELVREGVDAVLRSSGETTEEERKRRAIAAAGRFRSGSRDLSTKHDAHLVKAFGS
jgi:Arc/MetJ-type ribon-helix-helix transcriptional regulator